MKRVRQGMLANQSSLLSHDCYLERPSRRKRRKVAKEAPKRKKQKVDTEEEEVPRRLRLTVPKEEVPKEETPQREHKSECGRF